MLYRRIAARSQTHSRLTGLTSPRSNKTRLISFGGTYLRRSQIFSDTLRTNV